MGRDRTRIERLEQLNQGGPVLGVTGSSPIVVEDAGAGVRNVRVTGLSGTNTGDQTITLTGAVTGSGSGSFPTTLATAQPDVHTWALTQTFTVAPIFTDAVGTLDGITKHGADIASATTTNIASATGRNLNITGTTTITALGTAADGVERVTRFTGALTLTHNATSMILLTGANITTVADDECGWLSLGSGNWRMQWYTRKDGSALVGGSGSSPLTTKGDLYTYSTTNDRLPVGANNTILVADSSASTGNKWATLSAEIDAAIGSTQGQVLYRGASAWSALSPGNIGQYLGTNGAGANPTWSQPSSTGGAGWVTALDLDFSAESNQTLSSNTNYTIGGLTWTKANSAADSVAMAVVNGSGLVIQPISASNYNGTSRTAPYLYTDLATIIGSAYFVDTPLRIWVYISADNISANADNAGLSLDNFGTSNTLMQNEMYRSASGGVKAIESGAAYNTSSLSSSRAASPLDNTDRVMVFQIPLGRWQGISTVFTGAYSSGWPALNSLIPRIRGGLSTGATISTSGTNQDPITGLPVKIVLTALRAGSGTALSVTIARIRIDYKNP